MHIIVNYEKKVVLAEPGSIYVVIYSTTDMVQNLRPCVCSLIRFHITHSFGFFHFSKVLSLFCCFHQTEV